MPRSLIALTAAIVALWLAFTLTRWWQRAAAGDRHGDRDMRHALYGHGCDGPSRRSRGCRRGATPISEPLLAGAIALGVFGIVLIGLVGAIYNRRREEDAIREAARLRAARRRADRGSAASRRTRST